MKFTTVLANGICMSDWLERAFLHGTQCKFETIQFAINARGTVKYEFLIWTRISQRLVRLQFELNSTMAHIRMLFWKGSLTRLGIHEKWNAWFTTIRFDACGVEFHVPIKPSVS